MLVAWNSKLSSRCQGLNNQVIEAHDISVYPTFCLLGFFLSKKGNWSSKECIKQNEEKIQGNQSILLTLAEVKTCYFPARCLTSKTSLFVFSIVPKFQAQWISDKLSNLVKIIKIQRNNHVSLPQKIFVRDFKQLVKQFVEQAQLDSKSLALELVLGRMWETLSLSSHCKCRMQHIASHWTRLEMYKPALNLLEWRLSLVPKNAAISCRPLFKANLFDKLGLLGSLVNNKRFRKFIFVWRGTKSARRQDPKGNRDPTWEKRGNQTKTWKT